MEHGILLLFSRRNDDAIPPSLPLVLSLVILLDDLAELLPQPPAFRPPRLLDLTVSALMGL
jgi:hypothetical protein